MMNLKTRINSLNDAETLQIEARKNLTGTIEALLRSIDVPVNGAVKLNGMIRPVELGNNSLTLYPATGNTSQFRVADLLLEELIALGEYLASEEFNMVLYNTKLKIDLKTGQILTVAAKLQTQNATKES